MRFVALLIAFACLASGEVQVSESRVSAGQSSRAPFAFSALGSKWTEGDPPRIRTSADGLSWSEWRSVQLSHDLADEPTGNLLFFDPPQAYVEVDSVPAGLRLVFIDPGASPLRKSRVNGAKPDMVSRTEWGCPDGENFRGTPTYTQVTHFIVHHTGDSYPTKDYPAWIRAIWTYHVFSNGWSDIGYNYLIDPEGTIYVGRAGGDNVLGAHFSCQNGGTMGVSLLGTYTSVRPAPATLDSLYSLLAWRAGVLNIDPLGITFHKGMNQNLDNISGHRDGNNSPQSCTRTECPGDAFYPALPEVRKQVAARIAAANWTPSGLWHLTSRRGGLSYWYGDDKTGSYDTPGQPNSGTLESSPFTLASDAKLTFRTIWQTEGPYPFYDQMWIEVKIGDAEWTPLKQIYGMSPYDWQIMSIDLPFRGNIRVRFRFDTMDALYNGFEGWYVDSIRVQ